MESSKLFKMCPLGCPGSLTDSTIVLSEGALRQCNTCGQLLSASDERHLKETLEEFDTPEGTLPANENLHRHRNRIESIIQRAIGLGKVSAKGVAAMSALDIGCSSGSVLQVARDIGLNMQGVEPAKSAAKTAQSMGFDVFAGTLQEAEFSDAKFDLITMFEVIEHLTDPLDLTQEARRVLKPGGVFVIGTANADSWTRQFLGAKWEYLDMNNLGGHISFFNPESIRLLAQTSGLGMVNIETKRVNLAERKDVSALAYMFVRIGRELLALPARWLNNGHDMLAIMRKPL